jgi:hypothetical protein
LSNDDNFDQLRSVLRLARDAYLADARPPPRSATSRATTMRTRRLRGARVQPAAAPATARR